MRTKGGEGGGRGAGNEGGEEASKTETRRDETRWPRRDKTRRDGQDETRQDETAETRDADGRCVGAALGIKIELVQMKKGKRVDTCYSKHRTCLDGGDQHRRSPKLESRK